VVFERVFHHGAVDYIDGDFTAPCTGECGITQITFVCGTDSGQRPVEECTALNREPNGHRGRCLDAVHETSGDEGMHNAFSGRLHLADDRPDAGRSVHAQAG